MPYQFQFSTSTGKASTLADLLKRLTNSALWTLEETVDLSSQQTDWNHVDEYFQHLASSLRIALEGSSAYCGLWGALVEKDSSDNSLTSFSLFDRRPPLSPVTSPLIPSSDQVTSLADLFDLILQQIHLLGRYYRQISLQYCEFLLMNSDESDMDRIKNWTMTLHNLMEEIENLTKKLLAGWRILILVCGVALVDQPLNQSQPP